MFSNIILFSDESHLMASSIGKIAVFELKSFKRCHFVQKKQQSGVVDGLVESSVNWSPS